MLHGVYPERENEILHFVQDDRRRVQHDRRRVQQDRRRVQDDSEGLSMTRSARAQHDTKRQMTFKV